MAQIFVSYATPDRAIADEVWSWLRAAGHEPFLAHELRDGISVGEDWKQRLYRELREVDAVIGVVTSSFVASNWCSAELGIADALGCRLMPVRVEAGVADDLLAAGPSTPQQRLLVVIDQAEELFTRTSPDALQRFAELLREAVVGPVQLIAAMRSEFLDDLRDLPALAGVPIEAYVLAPLEREMLPEVIEQPAKVARLRVENGLAARLVADTGSGEALPLLAFTLRQLADGLPVGGTLTLARYQDLGGVRGALTRHADTALAEAVRASGLAERDVLAGLTRLVTVDETGRRARRRIREVAFSPDGRTLATVSADQTVRLWDVGDRERPRQLGQPR